MTTIGSWPMSRTVKREPWRRRARSRKAVGRVQYPIVWRAAGSLGPAGSSSVISGHLSSAARERSVTAVSVSGSDPLRGRCLGRAGCELHALLEVAAADEPDVAQVVLVHT